MVASNVDISVSLSCPICMENYSETRFPVVSPQCGHSICTICANARRSNICSTCGIASNYGETATASTGLVGLVRNSTSPSHYMGFPWNSNDWKKNFALLELIDHHVLYTENEKRERDRVREQARREVQTAREQAKREMQTAREQKEREVQTEKEARERAEHELAEMKRKYEKELPNDVDCVSCSLCHTKERRDRLKICVTCAKEGNVELKDTEEKILPFIICSHCSQEDHGGHQIVKYLPWKNKDVLNSIVSYGKSTVSLMDEVCRHVIDKGVEGLREWNEQMEVFRIVDDKLPYRECLNIESAVKAEADLVCRASEDTLPKLRMFTKSLEDSKQRLKRLASKMNGEEEDEKKDNEEDEDNVVVVVVEVPEKKRRI